jgi:pyruvate dehydrogenase E2 component (dihydrolipoamide acetyltransferase)
MEEATIVSWLVADGDQVKAGRGLAEIETDKATVTLESEADGVITLVVGVGETARLGAVIARIEAPGEARPGSAGAQAATKPDGSISHAQTPTVSPPATRTGTASSSDRPSASPVAQRIASSLGVDLGSLTGTGPRGRIVRADVENAVARASEATTVTAPQNEAAADPQAVQAVAESEPRPAKGTASIVEPSRTQQLIARRMAESRATIPDLDVALDVDMEAAWDLRAQLKQQSGQAPAPSLNDMVVMACARVIAEQPRLNSAYRDSHVERFERINIGIAVALPDALVVPTIFDADRQPLKDIARTSRQLVAKVRDGSIAPAELAGGTFTVSNLGMYGIDAFTAVINPPQAAILAIGAIKQRAVVREGELAARRTMTVTLAADHRVVYGADAARFLARLRELLEQPLSLLLG